MELNNLKCPNCGAEVNYYGDLKRAICNYCGSNYFVTGDGVGEDVSINRPVAYRLIKEKNVDIDLSDVFDLVNNLESILILLSGLSYKLKECFVVKYDYNKSGSKDYNLDFGLFKVPFSSTSGANKDEIQLNNLLNEYGFVTEDVGEEKSISYNEGLFSVSDKFKKVLSKLVITPFYFDKYFSEYNDFIKRIESNKEVDLIVDRILKIDFKSFYIRKDGISVINDNKKVRIKFKEFGMNDVSDNKLLLSLGIVLANKIITRTMKNGSYKYLIENASVEKLIDDFISVSFTLRNAVIIEEVYKEW